MRKLLVLIALTALSAAQAENTDTSGGKNLDGAEQMYPQVETGTSFSSSFLINESDEFTSHLKPDHVLVRVDFDAALGKVAPVSIEGNNFAVGLNGDAQVVASYQDLPATYWFGDQADSTFVLANGSVQIVFPQDVDAVSLLTTTADKEKLLPEQDVSGQAGAGQTILVDANGLMVSQGPITIKSGSAFLGIVSDIPFRSVIISSTAETWLFSNLSYEAEASVAK